MSTVVRDAHNGVVEKLALQSAVTKNLSNFDNPIQGIPDKINEYRHILSKLIITRGEATLPYCNSETFYSIQRNVHFRDSLFK